MGQTHTGIMKNKRKKKFEAKEEYFIRNGGILLEKQIVLSQGKDIGARQLKVLSSADIEKATNCYDPDFMVGSSFCSTVYIGILDDRIVVVKTPLHLEPDPDLVNRCLTAVSTAVEMNHDNIAMDWADRLSIATDIAYALSYMHNALSKPVVHRDVDSASVLLDYSFHAKLSNFGYSLPITPGDTSQKWPVVGTLGYIDPEYLKTQKVTDKCDVYSLRVLMLELQTRRRPLRMARYGEDLVDSFVLAMGKLNIA
ncbi:Wall-associated receptor kinase-like 9 [Bienertia sinuspersici]